MYEPLTHRKGVESWFVEYQGDVRPHPRFEVQLDEWGRAAVHHADLAIIRLDDPVQKNILPVRLADAEATVGEFLAVVGYGYIEELSSGDGTRRFSREEVRELLEPDRKNVLFGSPDSSSYKGDTGGPCLRETDQGSELLGISNRGLGQAPTFTSIPHYREWLVEEIRLAGQRAPTP